MCADPFALDGLRGSIAIVGIRQNFGENDDIFTIGRPSRQDLCHGIFGDGSFEMDLPEAWKDLGDRKALCGDSNTSNGTKPGTH